MIHEPVDSDSILECARSASHGAVMVPTGG